VRAARRVRWRGQWIIAAWASLSLAVGCVGDAGGDTVDFDVAAAGPADAVAGQPLSFTQEGWNISLTKATLHVGALYFVQAGSVSGAQATGCYLTNQAEYVLQETGRSAQPSGPPGLDVDLLSPAPQPFAAKGHGITQPTAMIGQVWLVHGDLDVAPDKLPMLTVAGAATQGATTFPFTGAITIGTNHEGTGIVAGGDPICKERIVTPITPVPAVQTSGGLLLRIDPRAFFNFSFDQRAGVGAAAAYTFSDDPRSWDSVSQDLYMNVRSTAPYSFTWVAGL
jgi:hypothetical protein